MGRRSTTRCQALKHLKHNSLAIKESCERQGVPFFFKQWGNWAPAVEPTKGRVHVWPDNTSSVHMHKKLAGRSLLNETHEGCFEFESLAGCPNKAECDARLARCAKIASSISVLDVDQFGNPMIEEADVFGPTSPIHQNSSTVKRH